MSRKNGRTLPQRLATVSWFVPLAILGVDFHLSMAEVEIGERIAGLLITSLSALGLLTGLSALVGIAKYGRKGVLWPSLIGIALSVFSLLIGVGTLTLEERASGKSAEMRIKKILKRQADMLNRSTPKDLGAGAGFLGATYEAPKTLILDYSVTAGRHERLPEGTREYLADKTCGTEWVTLLGDPEVVFVHRYTVNGDESNRMEHRISVGECENPAEHEEVFAEPQPDSPLSPSDK